MSKEQQSGRPVQLEQPQRLREAGSIEKRGGWQKPTARPTSAAQQSQQGMPPKPVGLVGQQGSASGAAGE